MPVFDIFSLVFFIIIKGEGVLLTLLCVCVKVCVDEQSFRWQLNEDAMATEKLAEGTAYSFVLWFYVVVSLAFLCCSEHPHSHSLCRNPQLWQGSRQAAGHARHQVLSVRRVPSDVHVVCTLFVGEKQKSKKGEEDRYDKTQTKYNKRMGSVGFIFSSSHGTSWA